MVFRRVPLLLIRSSSQHSILTNKQTKTCKPTTLFPNIEAIRNIKGKKEKDQTGAERIRLVTFTLNSCFICFLGFCISRVEINHLLLKNSNKSFIIKLTSWSRLVLRYLILVQTLAKCISEGLELICALMMTLSYWILGNDRWS